MHWSEFEWDSDLDEEVEHELRLESEAQELEDLRLSDYHMARLHRLEDYYFSENGWKPLVFWRLRYYGWMDGLISSLECLRRLHKLMDSEDGHMRYEARCDIKSRLYRGKRIWW